MGVAPFVSNLYQDLKDGLVLIQVCCFLDVHYLELI